MPRKMPKKTKTKRKTRGGSLRGWVEKARSYAKSMKGTNMYSNLGSKLHNQFKPMIAKKLGNNAFMVNQGIEYGLNQLKQNGYGLHRAGSGKHGSGIRRAGMGNRLKY